MTNTFAYRPPHARYADRGARESRLRKRERQAAAAVERIPELLPATCPTCRVVLGLVEADGAILCRDCGVWAPADDLAGIAEVVS